jgi:glucose/arabinose dehydrogenase
MHHLATATPEPVRLAIPDAALREALAAFLTLHGSWNRNPPNGYRVSRLRFSAAGEPVGYEDFLTGFLYDGTKVFGRPAGLAVLPDGSLGVGDDFNGVVYRVAYAPPS